jgi:hypothetical protein
MKTLPKRHFSNAKGQAFQLRKEFLLRTLPQIWPLSERSACPDDGARQGRISIKTAK